MYAHMLLMHSSDTFFIIKMLITYVSSHFPVGFNVYCYHRENVAPSTWPVCWDLWCSLGAAFAIQITPDAC